MYPESRVIIHMGINFVVSPVPTIDMQNNLKFQQSLVTRGIEFAKVEFKEREIAVVREAPTHLEIKVAAISPSPVAQLLIVAPHPRRVLALFNKEAEAVVEAFESYVAGEEEADNIERRHSS